MINCQHSLTNAAVYIHADEVGHPKINTQKTRKLFIFSHCPRHEAQLNSAQLQVSASTVFFSLISNLKIDFSFSRLLLPGFSLLVPSISVRQLATQWTNFFCLPHNFILLRLEEFILAFPNTSRRRQRAILTLVKIARFLFTLWQENFSENSLSFRRSLSERALATNKWSLNGKLFFFSFLFAKRRRKTDVKIIFPS